MPDLLPYYSASQRNYRVEYSAQLDIYRQQRLYGVHIRSLARTKRISANRGSDRSVPPVRRSAFARGLRPEVRYPLRFFFVQVRMMRPNRQPQDVSTRPAPDYDAAFPSANVLLPVRHCATSRAVQADQGPAKDGWPGPVGRDPWSATVANLFRSSSSPDPNWVAPDPLTPGSCRPAHHGQSRGADLRTFTVTVLEQLSNSLVALSWRDPTLCNYEEQMWSPGLARTSGRCALSGLHISKGDAIYKPITRGRTVPLNRDAMILSSALHNVRDTP